MDDDPIIDEIRRVRHRISEECGHDPKTLVEYFMKIQEQYRDRLIKPDPDSETHRKSAA
jgi:hypothetical protein